MTANQGRSLRRAAGISVAAIPFAVCVASWALPAAPWQPQVGIRLVQFALFLALLDVHLSFIRPWLYRLRHGSMAEFQFISGLPLLGTVLALVGVAADFGHASTAALAIAALLLDTAGLPWAAVVYSCQATAPPSAQISCPRP